MSGAAAHEHSDAALAACLFAADPKGLGGLVLRARPGPARDRFLGFVRTLLPNDKPFRKLPPAIGDDRLLGGLDLTATLTAGKPMLARGLLAEADGGVVLVPMAERLDAGVAAKLCAVLDDGHVVVERDGLTHKSKSEIGLVLIDEGIEADEIVLPALTDRVAFLVGDLDNADPKALPFTVSEVAAARAASACIDFPAAILTILCKTAAAIGVASNRALFLALRAARIHAALSGRAAVAPEDAAVAARLVLAPRATMMPAETDQHDEPPPPEPNEQDSKSDDDTGRDQAGDIVLEAVRAAIPPGLLERLNERHAARARLRQAGKAGQQRKSAKRGRPIGTRQGELKSGARLNVIETLQAAAPWQSLRRRARPEAATSRIQVRREDFRIVRFKQHSETLTIFVVDASGSSAVHRLAEAKGAVELLLADCYVRRDQVALFAFRGEGAELLLPPTRSLARAKRSLAALPGGGATPLATAIDCGRLLAEAAARKGQTPLLVLLTDGRANIARDRTQGRERAEADATAAAKAMARLNVKSLLVDISKSPHPNARQIADDLRALYLPLPRADAAAISGAVRAAAR